MPGVSNICTFHQSISSFIKTAVRNEGTGREAVFIDTELTGNEYLMIRQVLKNADSSEEGKVGVYQREAHIIHLILNGYSLVEISRRLLISIKTVQSYVNIILHKLNATKISEIYRCKSLIIDSFAGKICIFNEIRIFLIHYPSINDKEKAMSAATLPREYYKVSFCTTALREPVLRPLLRKTTPNRRITETMAENR